MAVMSTASDVAARSGSEGVFLYRTGLVRTSGDRLTEMIELPREVHPWFVGVQFHPEFKSTPWDGHPLFNAFIKAALAHQATAAGEAGKTLKAVK